MMYSAVLHPLLFRENTRTIPLVLKGGRSDFAGHFVVVGFASNQAGLPGGTRVAREGSERTWARGNRDG